MRKPKILHVIDSLGLGGAEQILVSYVNRHDDFEHVVVYLNGDASLAHNLNCKVICLNFKSFLSTTLKASRQLKALILAHEADLVHSHLYWSTIVSRLAVGRTPLVTTYHSLMYQDVGFFSTAVFRNVDKLTYRERFHTICVSKTVQRHIGRELGISRNCTVIYNFVDNKFTEVLWTPRKEKTGIKLLSVGNIKPAKNYFKYIPQLGKMKGVFWDIVGGGPFLQSIQEEIKKKQISNINILSNRPEVDKIMCDYDLFFMPSRSEGFGIALAEALAAGMPCLISDIETFREIANEQVSYIDDSLRIEDQVEQAISIVPDKTKIASLTPRKFISDLGKIYRKCLQPNAFA